MVDREAQIEAEIKALYAERETIRSNRLWTCPACKKKTKISSLEVFQDYYYNCEDWYTSDRFHIQCPKCNKTSSGIAGSKHWPGWDKVKEHLSYFKKISPVYDR